MGDLRQEVDIISLLPFVEWILSKPGFAREIFSAPHPRHLKAMGTHPIMPSIGLGKELLWAAFYLSQYADILSNFSIDTLEFDTFLISAQYARANNKLNEIESSYGQSLWLIKNKIACLQLGQGLEAQKTFAQSIRNQRGAQGAAPFVAYHVSVRNEETVTADRFVAQFSQQLEAMKLSEDLSDYLKYHIIPTVNLTVEKMDNILRHEQSNTVVDAYEAFILISRIIIANDYGSVRAELGVGLGILSKVVRDSRIHTLLVQLGDEQIRLPRTLDEVAQATESVLQGDYTSTAHATSRGLAQSPNHSELLFLHARALVGASAASPGRTLYQDEDSKAAIVKLLPMYMATVMSGGDTSDVASGKLLRYSLNFFGQPWADAAGFLSRKEQSPEPTQQLETMVRFSMAGSRHASPSHVAWISESRVRSTYARHLISLCGNESVTRYINILLCNNMDEANDAFDFFERALVQAESAVRDGNFRAALVEVNKLDSSPNHYHQRNYVRLRSHCLVELNMIEECINFAGHVLSKNVDLHTIIPMRRIMSGMDKGMIASMASNLSLPIFLHSYSWFIDNKNPEVVQFAYEDFLAESDTTSPTDIIVRAANFDHDQLVYFLRSICTEAIMAKSATFPGSKAVAEERLAICRFLLEFDPRNSDIAQSEILEILWRIMVRRRLYDVEQSKIYIDIDGIARVVNAGVRENFNRYIAFLRAGLGESQASYGEAFRKKARAHDIQGMLELSLPDSEVSELFKSIVLDIRDEFVSNTAHGLDGYLSVRIRHGTLVAQLRSPLEVDGLIMQRDEAGGTYRPNDEWATKLTASNPALKETILERLSKFSALVDGVVQKIVLEWVQVKKQPSDNGLFDFSFDKQTIDFHAGLVSVDMNFEEFANYVLITLQKRLALSLEKVRDTIEKQAKLRFSELLDEVQIDISALCSPGDVGDFNNAIATARASVLSTFDRVIAWFHASNTQLSEPFMVEDAIRVSVESVRTATRAVEISVSLENENNGRLIVGLLLPAVVDIFFIVFENITKHSGMASPQQADVKMVYYDESVFCRITNRVATGVASEETAERLASIKTAMDESRHLSSVVTEGGTGFHKICKILEHDMGCPRKLDFGFSSPQEFYIDIEFQIRLQYLVP